MSDDDDFAFEPVRGLPAPLPAGERILWRGGPDWRRLAVTAFHIRAVAIYFALVAAWNVARAESGLVEPLLWTGVAAAAAIGILTGIAWLYARTSVYTLTTRRIVIRSGLALPVTVNLPLSRIDGASVRRHGARSGSIALSIAPPERVAWLVLWPHVRPFNITRPQPMLRALDDVDAVIPLLTEALKSTPPARANDREPAQSRPEPIAAAGAAA